MAKRNYNGGGSKAILSNAPGNHANLPQDVMFKNAGDDYEGLARMDIGDEYANIDKQMSGDQAKARQDYKLRKA